MAVGRIRTQDGLQAEICSQKHIDLNAKKGAMESKYSEDWEHKNKYGGGKDPKGWDIKKPWPAQKAEYVKHYTDRDINQIRETIEERCASGAQTRVVRHVLHLPVAFAPAKNNKTLHDGISKSFYIVRYILDGLNPMVQQAQLAQYQQAAYQAIYGIPAPASCLTVPQVKQIQRIEVKEEEEEPEDPENLEEPEPDNCLSKEEGMIIDFENQSPEDQEKTILSMIKRNNYRHYDHDMKNNPPLHLWSQEGRTDYFKHILTAKKGAA